MHNKDEISFDKPIGIKDGEIYFLNYVFKHEDGFKGATGFSLRPLDQKEVDYRNTPLYYEDIYRDSWKCEVSADTTEFGLAEYIEHYIKPNEYDVDYAGHDTSYSEHYDEAKTHFKNAVSFECGSGGRCFNHKLLNSFDIVINQELIDLIKKYEDEVNET